MEETLDDLWDEYDDLVQYWQKYIRRDDMLAADDYLKRIQEQRKKIAEFIRKEK